MAVGHPVSAGAFGIDDGAAVEDEQVEERATEETAAEGASCYVSNFVTGEAKGVKADVGRSARRVTLTYYVRKRFSRTIH